MNILILGGHGFLGKNLVESFKNHKFKIFALSRRDGLDLTDLAITEKYFKDIRPNIIINCAANVGSLNYVTQKAAEICDVNMRMLLNIYKAAQKHTPNAIQINPVANCAFPGNLENYSENQFWDGKIHQSVLPYGSTRRMIIVLSECYRMQHGFHTINFFVPNMYGPYDSTDPNKAHALNALVCKLVKAKIENKPEFEAWGKGIAIREWLYAKDCASIFLKTIMRLDDHGFDEPINIAQNFGFSIRELLKIIIEEIGYSGKIAWNLNMPDGALKKVMNDSRFRKVFPNFIFTDIIEGVRATIKYYESIYPY